MPEVPTENLAKVLFFTPRRKVMAKETETEEYVPRELSTIQMEWAELGKETRADERVNHPSHYNQGKIEVIDYIEDQDFNFNLGNAVKYISRAGKKNMTATTEDLKKAAWYLNREIQRIEGLS